ncbi:PIN domain-containing protein [uncultured Spirosoma sp.]|uniref:PIN domain-containing protein n=1 Tax=uncultured Spirosoma sp. TaxID=278208 RepID=UPI002587DF7D|nr:PIN domain-containing protein [uncultured Spirosoma sp.]
MVQSTRSFVVDANVLFSCLISGYDHYLRFLTDNRIYTPDFALEEIQLYQDRILKRTKLDTTAFSQFTLTLFEQLIVVPNMLITTQSYYQAFDLCKRVDPNDTAYVALSIQLGEPLLTRDKVLANGLRQQGFATVLTLDELFQG